MRTEKLKAKNYQLNLRQYIYRITNVTHTCAVTKKRYRKI